MTKPLGKVGIIGRFKPLHNGAATVFEILCEKADQVLVGIGSSNKYDVSNPFTAAESEGMIRAFLQNKENVEVIHVPDFAHIPEYRDGKKWKEYVLDKFGRLDFLINSNPYVAQLLGDNYDMIHPGALMPEEKRTDLKATKVRLAMARGENWQQYVPKEVANYIERNWLAERFRREFGKQTIELIASHPELVKRELPEFEKLKATGELK